MTSLLYKVVRPPHPPKNPSAARPYAVSQQYPWNRETKTLPMQNPNGQPGPCDDEKMHTVDQRCVLYNVASTAPFRPGESGATASTLSLGLATCLFRRSASHVPLFWTEALREILTWTASTIPERNNIPSPWHSWQATFAVTLQTYHIKPTWACYTSGRPSAEWTKRTYGTS